jgi:hypothetical protein
MLVAGAAVQEIQTMGSNLAPIRLDLEVLVAEEMLVLLLVLDQLVIPEPPIRVAVAVAALVTT